jgi:hypothetical protein
LDFPSNIAKCGRHVLRRAGILPAFFPATAQIKVAGKMPALRPHSAPCPKNEIGRPTSAANLKSATHFNFVKRAQLLEGFGGGATL